MTCQYLYKPNYSCQEPAAWIMPAIMDDGTFVEVHYCEIHKPMVQEQLEAAMADCPDLIERIRAG